MRQTVQPLSGVSTITAAPLASDVGSSLNPGEENMTVQIDIPVSATATVKIMGKVESTSPWVELDSVTSSQIRVHYATPYVTAYVASYSGTGGINVWVTRDDC